MSDQQDNTPQHAPEPWAVEMEAMKPWCIRIYDGERLVVGGERIAGSSAHRTIDDVRAAAGFPVDQRTRVAAMVAQQEQDYTRIVAAVNSCAGIPTAALEAGAVAAMLDALREARRALADVEQHQRDAGEPWMAFARDVQRIDAAIAAATGEGVTA